MYLPFSGHEVVLSRAPGSRLAAIDEALAEAGADANTVQVIFYFEPEGEQGDQPGHAPTRRGTSGRADPEP